MKLIKSSFQFLFVFLTAISLLFAQTVSGTVSGVDGETLAGANIMVEGTDMGSSSNTDGSYSISGLSDGSYTITASYIGYESESVTVTISGGQTASADFMLDKGNLRLNQVVVSASLKKELVTEAPASVEVFSGEELEARQGATIVDAFANRAGVETMKTGIESSNMTVRGFNGVFSGAIHAVLDNRWVRAPVVNAQLLQFMNADDSDVARVELVRGPAAPMYGPDTQQGVLSIFTKSPFDQGNRMSLTLGERNYQKLYGRITQQWMGGRAATRVTLLHRTFEDWSSNMPKTIQEAQAEGHLYYEPEYIRRGMPIPTYPYIDYASSEFGDPEGGVFNSAAHSEPFKPSVTSIDMKTEIRPDLKSTLTVNFRQAQLSAIEMTGVGRALSDDTTLSQAQIAYNRQDFLGGNLFINFFTNINEQKTTYLLNTGNIIYDESSNRALQLQHSLDLRNGQSLVWGLDYLDRTPETKGTINGKNEDNDNFNNVGIYYSYEKKFSDRFKFVNSGRIDNNNYLRAIGTDYVFAPKIGLVWSNPDVRGNFRLTYGENIDLPGNFTKNLDIAAATNVVYAGLGINFAPLLGFQPDYSVKAMGSTTTGWTYQKDANGNTMFRSNWSTALGLDTNTYYSMNNNTINAAAWGVWAPIIGGGFLQSADGAAFLTAYGSAVGQAAGAGYMEQVVTTVYTQTYQGYIDAGADAATAAAAAQAAAAAAAEDPTYLAAAAAFGAEYGANAAATGAGDLITMLGATAPSAFGNITIDLDGNILNPNTAFPDYPQIKETTWAQTEFGYKGLVGDNMSLTVDVYNLKVSNYVTALQNISGLTNVVGDGGSYVASLATYLATQGNENLANMVGAFDSPLAGGNGNGTGLDDLAAAIIGGVARVPIGAIAPAQSLYGGNLVYGYKQLTSDLHLNGLEATLNYFPNNSWNFYGNVSLLDKNRIDVDFEGVTNTVNMNTPKFKLGAGMQYIGDGESYGLSLRYQDSYYSDGFSGNAGRIESFYTLSLNAKWDVDMFEGMSVGVSIDNLTDIVHRETFLGPEMGRFSTISVGYDF